MPSIRIKTSLKEKLLFVDTIHEAGAVKNKKGAMSDFMVIDVDKEVEEQTEKLVKVFGMQNILIIVFYQWRKI